MQLAPMAQDGGLQITEEYAYGYNGTGGATAVGDVMAFDILTASRTFLTSGSTSMWNNFVAVAAGHTLCAMVAVATEVKASGLLTKAVVRSQAVRANTTSVGALAVGAVGVAAAATKSFQVGAAVTTPKYFAMTLEAIAGAGTQIVYCFVDGISGIR